MRTELHDIFNTDQKLAAIEQAAKMLASFPEKKALVYFSSGVSKTGIENQAQLEASINAAVKANLAIYPVDARGLMADPPGGNASKAASRGAGIFNGSAYNSQRAGINDSQETLFTLAEETGGKAFLDSNDIEAGITQAQEGMGSYYLLGYYSTNNAKDGKYRRITVKMNSKFAGVKLEHRPGYYADKVWGKLNSQDKDQQLKEALSAGDPDTDLPLALQVDYFRVSPAPPILFRCLLKFRGRSCRTLAGEGRSQHDTLRFSRRPDSGRAARHRRQCAR